jgi:hypothetical protein
VGERHRTRRECTYEPVGQCSCPDYHDHADTELYASEVAANDRRHYCENPALQVMKMSSVVQFETSQ